MLPEGFERRDLSSLETMLKYSDLSDEDRQALVKLIESKKKNLEKKKPYAGLQMRSGMDAVRYPHLPLDSEIIRAYESSKTSVATVFAFREEFSRTYGLTASEKRHLEEIINKHTEDRGQEALRRRAEEKDAKVRALRATMMPDAKRWMLEPIREKKKTKKRWVHSTSELPKKRDLKTMSTDALLTYTVDHFDYLSPYEMGIIQHYIWERTEKERRAFEAAPSSYRRKTPKEEDEFRDLVAVKRLCWKELVAAKEKKTGKKVGAGYAHTVPKVVLGIVGGVGGVFGLCCAAVFLYVFFAMPLGSMGEHIINYEKYEQEVAEKRAEREVEAAAEEEAKEQEELAKIEQWKQEHQEQSLPDTSPREVGPGTDYYIKGNISADGERIYHMPGDAYYDETVINESRGERWFSSPEEAEAAGWRRAYV